MDKPRILSLTEREELKLGAESVVERAPEGDWMFVRGCLSLIAELEIKEAMILRYAQNNVADKRCLSQTYRPSGVYRCIYERNDGHTEHHYNFFRLLTKQEHKDWFPEDKDA